jgi:hypothetical protein
MNANTGINKKKIPIAGMDKTSDVQPVGNLSFVKFMFWYKDMH